MSAFLKYGPDRLLRFLSAGGPQGPVSRQTYSPGILQTPGDRCVCGDVSRRPLRVQIRRSSHTVKTSKTNLREIPSEGHLQSAHHWRLVALEATIIKRPPINAASARRGQHLFHQKSPSPVAFCTDATKNVRFWSSPFSCFQ